MSEVRLTPCFQCGLPMTVLRVDFIGTVPVNILHCIACEKLPTEAAVQHEALDLSRRRSIALQ